MLLLEARNIEKYYSDRLIIGFDELKIYSGDKIGIVGQNGSGKTTLMNILSNEIAPDQGFIRQYCETSYIRQFSNESIEAKHKVLKTFNLVQKSKQKVFSGGEHTRIKLANAFSQFNVLLFADEPTSNLDYKGIELLKEKMSRLETFLIISHDRILLDCLCTKTLEVRNGKIKIYNGNYSAYKAQCDMNYHHSERTYEKYIHEKTNLEDAITNRNAKVKSMRKVPKRMGNSEARLHKRSTTEIQQKVSKNIKSLQSRLDKLEVKEKPKELSKIKIDFSLTKPPENKIVIASNKLYFSYDKKKIFDNIVFNIYNGSKTALWGENGAGKSTLLNLINSSECENISIVPKARIGYFYQNFENLDYSKSIIENVMMDSVQTQTTVRIILARLLISGDNVYKKVECLSGGEKIKVSFAKLIVSGANILLLDEPTNYLDMQSIEALENVLCEYEGTVLFVSHDSTFVNKVADRLFVFENYNILEFEGTLKEYKLSKEKSDNIAKKEMEQVVLKMKLTEITTKLSQSNGNLEDLEDEYQRLIKQLNN